MKRILTFIALAIGTSSLWAQAQTMAYSACSPSERWTIPLLPEVDAEFRGFVEKRSSLPRSFAESLSLRAQARTAEEKTFSEYWTTRTLHETGLIRLAHRGYQAILQKSEKHPGIAKAALECLIQIHQKHPTLDWSPAAVAATLKLPPSSIQKEAILIFSELYGPKNFVKTISEKDPEGQWIRALDSVTSKQYEPAIKILASLFAIPQAQWPDTLRTRNEWITLTYARALYATKKYSESSREYRKIPPTSNHLTTALSELAWSELQGSRLTQAVGAAINLNSGGLKKTFAPEGLMIMGMAFNEMCHFPESVQSLNRLKSQYRESFEFLKSWYGKGAIPHEPYAAVVKFLREKKSPIPFRVMSEWIKQDEFLSKQEEINLYAREKKAVAAFQKSASSEQARQGNELLSFIADLKPKYDQGKHAADDLKSLRTLVSHYQRLRRSAEPFRKMAEYSEAKSIELQPKRMAEINQALDRVGKRMLKQLEEIADNIEFIEAEIYQGASADIVWRNANPDYESVSRDIAAQSASPNAAEVYSWGNVTLQDSGVHEIWEDELGAFQVDLIDNCDNKDRYAQLKRKKKK